MKDERLPFGLVAITIFFGQDFDAFEGFYPSYDIGTMQWTNAIFQHL